MRIILTNHARLRCAQRLISIQEITDCVIFPDKIETELSWSEVVTCYKKAWWTFLLLVYWKDKKGDLIIITAIKTSNIKKYLK